MADGVVSAERWSRASCIRLDPVGGVSGDMFISAASDAAPAVRAALEEAFTAFPFPAGCQATFGNARRGGLAAATFAFTAPAGAGQGGHSWDAVRRLFASSRLPADVASHALGIYGLIAAAEAAVHGIDVADVHFHELGDWDSVADVLGAAVVIASCPQARWSVGSLPLGSGTIETAHGRLPVPSPAAAWLMRGFRCHQDNLPGERVTPTGAAILRHLKADSPPPAGSLELLAAGCGAGSRELPAMPNVLRLLALGPAVAAAGAPGSSDVVAVLRFEVDDQTPEDLAIGLERLRAVAGVLDVTVGSVQGKKGRLLYAVQVIAREDERLPVLEACLAETATIGVRWRLESRLTLPRRETVSGGPGEQVRVKHVIRPGGRETRKAEADDMARLDADYARRRAARERAEHAAGDGDD